MTIKRGTRVLVHYEGAVGDVCQDGTYEVIPSPRQMGETSAYLHPSRFEVIPEPLRVGDVITADSPEPPDGTTIMDQNGDCARRGGELWHVTWGTARAWEELVRVQIGGRHATWTVQRVGKGHS